MSMASKGYTQESVERALQHHLDGGRIRSWTPVSGLQYVVVLTSGDGLALKSLREAYVFVLGLASAEQAVLRIANQ